MQKPPSQRQLRVGEQLKHIIAETFLRGNFSQEMLLDIQGKVTVTEVRASPDLRNATAYVVTQNDENTQEIIEALNKDAKIFQKEINRQANLKFTPRMSFKRDQSLAKAGRIESLLDSITYSDQNPDEVEDI